MSDEHAEKKRTGATIMFLIGIALMPLCAFLMYFDRRTAAYIVVIVALTTMVTSMIIIAKNSYPGDMKNN